MSSPGCPESLNEDGVVRNSALSFINAQQPQAQAQPQIKAQDESSQILGMIDKRPAEHAMTPDRAVPPGVRALCDACLRVYPDQPNPLQVTTKLKYWLGGRDPLDYISMYWNEGDEARNVPPHWHYVSFGLSDLHGDGRVHPADGPRSGLGLELTFRLASRERRAPLWPAVLLQAIARYCITTGNVLCVGDHISWHRALDGGTSRLRHLLAASDPQLTRVDSPHGYLTFLQLVGCTERELRAAQRGSGLDVLSLIAADPSCGGEWLVSCMGRRTARGVKRALTKGWEKAADLAGVSAGLCWAPWNPNEETPHCANETKTETSRSDARMSTDSFEMSSIERALPELPSVMEMPLSETVYLPGVHIVLNAEGASLLPLAIQGRVQWGMHFTWRDGGTALTVLPPTVYGARASLRRPYAAAGLWLQACISEDCAREIASATKCLSTLCYHDSEESGDEEDKEERSGEEKSQNPPPRLPIDFTFPKYGLKITVTEQIFL